MNPLPEKRRWVLCYSHSLLPDKLSSLWKVARRSRDGRSITPLFHFRRDKKIRHTFFRIPDYILVLNIFFSLAAGHSFLKERIKELLFCFSTGSSAALLIFLAASAGAGIVNAYLFTFVTLGSCLFTSVTAG